ncbi:MAG: LacI family DNA-binding transcriptional regulator [Oscillospiraceae bacterium]
MSNIVKKVTIKSIAEELGISFSTVSKSLNGSSLVKMETREMVLQKAKDMGYAPNLLARGLRTNSIKTIAVIFNDIENPVLTYIFKTISVTMAEHGYTTMIFDSQFEKKSEYTTVQSVISRMPDFVIIAPSTNDYSNVDLLLSHLDNVIVFDTKRLELDTHFVDVDYSYGGYLAASELLSKGHRDILIITEPLDYPYSTQYVAGIRKAYEEYNVPFKDDYMQFAHSSMESACSIILSLWDQKEHKFKLPFTATMCFGDNFALGVYKAAAQLGLSVPDDISVIGFDDNDICEFTSPPLHSVHLPKEKMAYSCLEILKNDLLDGKPSNGFYSLSPHLVSRKSVKAIY